MKDDATPVDIALAAKKWYILNSAVITTPGVYDYRLVNVDVMQHWVTVEGWESTIGYEETAMALEELTGVKIPVNRKIIKMKQGDEALVFRLIFPKGYRPDVHKKGKLGRKFILKHCEMGILKKVADSEATNVCGY